MRHMAHKIGAIGDKDSVLPFKLFDFDTRTTKDKQLIRQQIDEMAKNDYGIISVSYTHLTLPTKA